MIDEDFKKIKSEIDHLKYLIDAAMNNYEGDSFENNKVYSKIETLECSLDSASNYIVYMSKKATEGTLSEMKNGKFECKEADITYSCGNRMEALIKTDNDEEEYWCVGSVEHEVNRGYYFYNYDGNNIFLYSGMKVRVRT